MAGLKRRWKIIVMLVIYVGVAVGGYAYFAAQNPITQLSKVASTTQLTAVEKEAKEFLSTTVKGYVVEDQTEFEFPTELGGFPVTQEAQDEGAELMKQHFGEIDSLRAEEQGPTFAGGTATIVVDPYLYEDSRIRPLPNRQAGIAVSTSVEIEFQNSEETFQSGTSMELGVIVDGPTQTITTITDSTYQGW